VTESASVSQFCIQGSFVEIYCRAHLRTHGDVKFAEHDDWAHLRKKNSATPIPLHHRPVFVNGLRTCVCARLCTG